MAPLTKKSVPDPSSGLGSGKGSGLPVTVHEYLHVHQKTRSQFYLTTRCQISDVTPCVTRTCTVQYCAVNSHSLAPVSPPRRCLLPFKYKSGTVSSSYSARRDFASSRAREQNAILNRDGPCNLCATSAHARCHARTTTFAPRLLEIEDKPSVSARRRIERVHRSRARACRRLQINFAANNEIPLPYADFE